MMGTAPMALEEKVRADPVGIRTTGVACSFIWVVERSRRVRQLDVWDGWT